MCILSRNVKVIRYDIHGDFSVLSNSNVNSEFMLLITFFRV